MVVLSAARVLPGDDLGRLGLAAVVLGHIPLGIWYLREVQTSGRDWVFAILYVALFIVVGVLKVGYGVLADETSAYPFAPEEMERFGRRRRLAQIRGGSESAPL